MDYEKLIETLRGDSVVDIFDCSNDAATAIETLLAEREAGIEKILKLQKSIADCIDRLKTMREGKMSK